MEIRAASLCRRRKLKHLIVRNQVVQQCKERIISGERLTHARCQIDNGLVTYSGILAIKIASIDIAHVVLYSKHDQFVILAVTAGIEVERAFLGQMVEFQSVLEKG